jgi:hypothetical protein
MSKAIRYWDLSDDEKEVLTREGLEAFFAVERMEKGVLLPEPLLIQSEEVPKPPTRTMYRPSGPGRFGSSDQYPFAFETIEEAEAFLKLNPRGLCEDWRGSKVPYVADGVGSKPLISLAPTEVTTEAEHNKIATRAQEAEKASDANRKAREEYNKGMKEAQEAISSISEDFELVQSRKRTSERIRRTYAEYLKLAGDNVTTAMAFLQKAYPDLDQVLRALGTTAGDPARAEELGSSVP